MALAGVRITLATSLDPGTLLYLIDGDPPHLFLNPPRWGALGEAERHAIILNLIRGRVPVEFPVYPHAPWHWQGRSRTNGHLGRALAQVPIERWTPIIRWGSIIQAYRQVILLPVGKPEYAAQEETGP